MKQFFKNLKERADRVAITVKEVVDRLVASIDKFYEEGGNKK